MSTKLSMFKSFCVVDTLMKVKFLFGRAVYIFLHILNQKTASLEIITEVCFMKAIDKQINRYTCEG